MTSEDTKMESYLVLFHVVSAGQNGAELGVDEEQIVHLSYAIVDKSQNKVIGRYGYHVRPSTSDINENLLSDQCRTDFGLTEADIKAAAPLEVVLRQFDQEAKAKGLEPHTCCLVTDGQLPVRQCLFPEATRKGITLPPYYYRFHDLRKEFAAAHPEASVSSIEDMLNVLGIELEADLKLAERQMHAMALLVHKLICDDVKLHEPDSVQERLEQSIRSREDSVDSNCVVRARGLPWQASDQDIARFFVGLNVAKGGVALCLSNQGRRNGEALVLFDSVQHRDLALKRHKHHIGNRYIEVYKATGEDFINVAGGNNLEAQKFLSRKAQVIIRMRGLPYDASAKQVIDFFARGDKPCSLVDGEEGILFVKKPDGRATGDAFVLLAEEDDAEKALRKHKENMGSRYIELFRSTTAEVQQVLNRTMEKHSGNKHHSSPLANGVLPPPAAVVTPNLPLIPHLPNTTLPPAAAIAASQHLITAGTRKDCIRLRGLPYEAEIENILDFLGEHATLIVNHGVHMIYNKEKQPSGEAFIQMKSEQAAFQAAQKKHYHHMHVGKKQRYIEVIQCSGEDMNYHLTGNVPSVTNGGVGGLPPTAVSSAISVASSASPMKNPIFSQAAIAAAAASNPLMAAATAGLLPPGGAALYNSMFGYTNGCENGLRPPHAPFGLPPHMSLFYWPYPSPPISPNNYFSLQQQPQMMTSIPNENGHFLSPAPPHQPPTAIIQSPTLPTSIEVSHVTQSQPGGAPVLGGTMPPSLIVNNNHKTPQKNSHKVENARTVEVYPT